MPKPSVKVKDPSLAEKGRMQIEWAERHMPVLMKIRERFRKERPLEGIKIAASLHVTKETAVLIRTLMAGGAEVALAPCNPLSTQDDVAAALAEEGVYVYAWRGMTERDYYNAIGNALSIEPDITMDDGADIISTFHKLALGMEDDTTKWAKEILGERDFAKMIEKVIGGTEETTTGVIRIKAMEKQGVLKYPVIAVVVSSVPPITLLIIFSKSRSPKISLAYLVDSSSIFSASLWKVDIKSAPSSIVMSGSISSALPIAL